MNHQRAIRQYLEDWQRSGIDRIAVDASAIAEAAATTTAPTKPARAKPTPAASPASPRVAKAAAASESPVAKKAVPAPNPVPPLVAPAPKPVVATQAAPVVTATPVTTGSPSTAPLMERIASLQVLSGACAACHKCGELAETRTQTVFGIGNPAASIMFIGEAPGADEDRQGLPFVGKAGQLLDKIIGACKLKREDVYICNILRCRPPGNRNPTPVEAANCREFLDGQIKIVDPDFIVCWGGVAAQNLLGVESSVGRLRGTMHTYGRAKVVCTYHPSYLLRNPSAKKDVWDDMKFLFAAMGVEL